MLPKMKGSNKNPYKLRKPISSRYPLSTAFKASNLQGIVTNLKKILTIAYKKMEPITISRMLYYLSKRGQISKWSQPQTGSMKSINKCFLRKRESSVHITNSDLHISKIYSNNRMLYNLYLLINIIIKGYFRETMQ